MNLKPLILWKTQATDGIETSKLVIKKKSRYQQICSSGLF